jgi:spore coat protein A
MITRRQVLGYGAVGAAGLVVGPAGVRMAGPVFAATGALPDATLARGLTKFTEALTQPPVWTPVQLAAQGLTMKESVTRFHRQLGTTRTWGYGGLPYGGPTIQAISGQPFSYTARNALGTHLLGVDTGLDGANTGDQLHPRTSLHLHGGYTESASDGNPTQTFLPGTSYRYNYTNDQQAASLIYHDHAMGLTRLNIYAGLIGAYLIRDPKAEVGLPTGKYDVPLILQDKSFLGRIGATNELYYPNPWEPEFFGDVMIVNGKAWPNLAVDRGVYRFRLINASSARFYNVHLSDGAPVIQIGSEYGLINKPLPLDSLVVAPGERAEVLIDFSKYAPGTKLVLKNLLLPEGVVSPGDDVLIEDIMQFTVTSATGWARNKIPAVLRPNDPIRPLPRPANITKRYVTLVEIMGPDGESPAMALINNRRFDTTDIADPKVDTVEEWNIVNLTADTHPIHLHLIGFQVAERQALDVNGYLLNYYGSDPLTLDDVDTGPYPIPSPASFLSGPVVPRGAFEAGWKDTVQVHPGFVTRILVPFGPSAAPGLPFGQQHRAHPFTGDYVVHCHILDHEDNDMMQPYKVIP